MLSHSFARKNVGSVINMILSCITMIDKEESRVLYFILIFLIFLNKKNKIVPPKYFFFLQKNLLGILPILCYTTVFFLSWQGCPPDLENQGSNVYF